MPSSCGGMWLGPRAAGCHVRAEQSQGLQFVSVFVCASFSLICGPNGNRQEGPELKFTAEDWVTGAWDRQRGEEGKSGRDKERGEAVWGAGRNDVCGHSLHRLLTRRGKANNARQQSSQPWQQCLEEADTIYMSSSMSLRGPGRGELPAIKTSVFTRGKRAARA